MVPSRRLIRQMSGRNLGIVSSTATNVPVKHSEEPNAETVGEEYKAILEEVQLCLAKRQHGNMPRDGYALTRMVYARKRRQLFDILVDRY